MKKIISLLTVVAMVLAFCAVPAMATGDPGKLLMRTSTDLSKAKAGDFFDVIVSLDDFTTSSMLQSMIYIQWDSTKVKLVKYNKKDGVAATAATASNLLGLKTISENSESAYFGKSVTLHVDDTPSWAAFTQTLTDQEDPLPLNASSFEDYEDISREGFEGYFSEEGGKKHLDLFMLRFQVVAEGDTGIKFRRSPYSGGVTESGITMDNVNMYPDSTIVPGFVVGSAGPDYTIVSEGWIGEDAITVPYGTDASSIDFPKYQIVYADGTANLTYEFNCAEYDAMTPGTYEFTVGDFVSSDVEYFKDYAVGQKAVSVTVTDELFINSVTLTTENDSTTKKILSAKPESNITLSDVVLSNDDLSVASASYKLYRSYDAAPDEYTAYTIGDNITLPTLEGYYYVELKVVANDGSVAVKKMPLFVRTSALKFTGLTLTGLNEQNRVKVNTDIDVDVTWAGAVTQGDDVKVFADLIEYSVANDADAKVATPDVANFVDNAAEGTTINSGTVAGKFILGAYLLETASGERAYGRKIVTVTDNWTAARINGINGENAPTIGASQDAEVELYVKYAAPGEVTYGFIACNTYTPVPENPEIADMDVTITNSDLIDGIKTVTIPSAKLNSLGIKNGKKGYVAVYAFYGDQIEYIGRKGFYLTQD